MRKGAFSGYKLANRNPLSSFCICDFFRNTLHKPGAILIPRFAILFETDTGILSFIIQPLSLFFFESSKPFLLNNDISPRTNDNQPISCKNISHTVIMDIFTFTRILNGKVFAWHRRQCAIDYGIGEPMGLHRICESRHEVPLRSS